MIDMDYSPPPIVVMAKAIVTGDSIATGIGHNGARGNELTEAQWGRNPSTQLRFMRSRGSFYYQGRDVVLSTGILNHEDWASVESQFVFLSQSNAKTVKIVGTPFAAYNHRLQQLCNKHGFTFLGGYKPGPDGIHPTSYTMMK